MKRLLITALSLLLVGATYAQEDDFDSPLTERNNLDGSPVVKRNIPMDHEWNSLSTIAISPFQYSENGVGIGLSYEHALDHDGIISVYVPVIATFNLRKNNRYDYDPYYYGGGPVNAPTNSNVMVYAMPGVKFYPTGMGKVKYAVGPSVVLGAGQKLVNDYVYVYDPVYNYYPGSYNYGVYDRYLLGMMLNNSLNINATRRLYVGAEMGFGLTYFDYVNNVNRGVTFLTQGAFKIGYTF